MIRNDIADLVTQAIKNAQAAGALPAFDPPAIEISRPKEAAKGDFTSPAAMQSAKPARMAPLAIAQAIAAHLPAADFIAAVEVAPPGFINFRLSDAWLAGQVAAIEAARAATATSIWAAARRARWSSSAPTRPGRCTWARRATPCWATRWRTCWRPPAGRSSANTTSTTPARRCAPSPRPSTGATCRRSARTRRWRATITRAPT